MDSGGTGGKPRRASGRLPHESFEDHGVAVSEPAQFGEDRVPLVLKTDLFPFQELDPLEDSCQMAQACFGFEGHLTIRSFFGPVSLWTDRRDRSRQPETTCLH